MKCCAEQGRTACCRLLSEERRSTTTSAEAAAGEVVFTKRKDLETNGKAAEEVKAITKKLKYKLNSNNV